MTKEAQRSTISSVWVGDRLLPIGHACINSFVQRGHAFHLYTYEEVKDVPAAVECRDADRIFSRDRLFRAHGGWETFADQFAYQFLYQVGGWWVDNDVVCNADVLPDVEIAFAEEDPGRLNNAVLKFPRHHGVMDSLLQYVTTVDPINTEWGSTGPVALTRVFRKHDIGRFERPMDEIYAVNWREAPKLLFPEFTDEILERTAKSPFIHLWGAAQREFGFDFSRHRPPDGSYMALLYERSLDPSIYRRLEPISEAPFRASVQDYIWKNWEVKLTLVKG